MSDKAPLERLLTIVETSSAPMTTNEALKAINTLLATEAKAKLKEPRARRGCRLGISGKEYEKYGCCAIYTEKTREISQERRAEQSGDAEWGWKEGSFRVPGMKEPVSGWFRAIFLGLYFLMGVHVGKKWL